MSAQDELPTSADLADWDAAELEEWLVESFDDFPEWHRRNAMHNRDGHFAKEAGSDECRALGHTEADFENDTTHSSSFDDDLLCNATQYGYCCTECEGECQYNYGEPSARLWSLPGVIA